MKMNHAVMHRTTRIKSAGAASAAIALLTLAVASSAHAQNVTFKRQGQIVCGSFSGDPKKYPAWNDTLEIAVDAGALIATPARAKGQVMRGAIGQSGAILLAGEGGPEGAAEWTFEFSGKFNPKGPTVIRGQLADIKGGGAKRQCSITF